MHIPECATQALEIVGFDEALRTYSGGYDPEKWLYVPDRYLD